MTKVMPKGSNTPLAKVDAVRAVLRWRIVPGSPDVDVSALLLGPDGRVRTDDDFVFYNQPRHPTGLVRHRSGARIGDELTQTVDIDLSKLPAAIDRVVVGGSVEEGDFDRITGLHILLFDIAGGPGAEALARFDIADTGGVTALLCGELYRRGDGWKFRAIGQGYSSGLVGLATDFGITIEEDELPAEAAATPAASATPAGAGAQAGSAAGGGTPGALPAPVEPGPAPEPEPVFPPPPSRPPTPVQTAPAQTAPMPPVPPQPPLLPEPAGFRLPLQGPQFQGR